MSVSHAGYFEMPVIDLLLEKRIPLDFDVAKLRTMEVRKKEDPLQPVLRSQ